MAAGGACRARPSRRPSASRLSSRSSWSIPRCSGCAPIRTICRSPTSKGEGFENKLAELFAEKLDKKVAYTWFPQATGFVRNTLGAHRCDVIMGFPQGDDLVQSTNPYYRTAYALVFKPGSGLDGHRDAWPIRG